MSRAERKDGSREPVAVSRKAMQRITGCQAIRQRLARGVRRRFPATGYRLPVTIFMAAVQT